MSNWGGRTIVPVLWGISAALLALSFTAQPAFGAGRSGGKRDSQEKAARKACLTGDHSAGVSILADLFVDHQDPIYVFNQGRCLEQNSRYKDAILRFEEFLHVGETIRLEPADRAAAHQHIEECKAKLVEEEKDRAPVAQPVAQPLPQPTPPTIAQPDATTRIAAKPEPEPAKGGRGLVVAGIVTGGVGVAALVAGVAFNLKANNMADEMENTVDAYTPNKNSSQEAYGTLAWVGYGVGAACTAAGTILIAVGVGQRGSSTKSDVALVPAVGRGQAGVLLRGDFYESAAAGCSCVGCLLGLPLRHGLRAQRG